jgi:magnesium-transporting ATPase (P-type)
MIEVAAVLSAIVGHWEDFGIIVALLLMNAGVGFWEEFQAVVQTIDVTAEESPSKSRISAGVGVALSTRTKLARL